MSSFPRLITEPFAYHLFIPAAGLCMITIRATCRSGNQIGQHGGEDLRVEIDSLQLREIPAVSRVQRNDIPPAWNGTQLHGASKTVVFVLHLTAGDHTLNFIPYRGAEILTEPTVALINDPHELTVMSGQQSEEGDRRPWFVCVLIDLSLHSLFLDASAKWRLGDSDDVKLIVDGNIKPNPSKLALLRRDWLMAGGLLRKLLVGERQKFYFEENLPSGIHYIELWVDRTPSIHALRLDLGEISVEEKQKRVPTVDDPAWTGDFRDDTEQMILARAIFGEARDAQLSDELRIGIGWSIRRRVEDRRWGDTYHNVITQPFQYSAFNDDDKNREYVEKPLHRNNPVDQNMWLRCYDIAGKVQLGDLSDPVSGANHYYDISRNEPSWAQAETFVRQIDTVRFYKL